MPTENDTYLGFKNDDNGTSFATTTEEETRHFSNLPTVAAPAGTEIEGRYKVLLYAGIPAIILASVTAFILFNIRRRRKSKSNDKTLFILLPWQQ